MKFEDLQKIFDSIRNNPIETIIIILILIIISIIGVYLKSYLSERAKRDAIKRLSKNREEKDVAERGTILIELGYSLYSFGLGADAIPEEFDSDRASRELKELYARLGLSIPKGEFGAERFKATRSALVSERDRHFLDVGMHLAAVYGIGIVMINHRGTKYEIQGKRKMSDLAHELKTALGSLGLLAAIEQERRIESYLMPTSNDTVEAYSQTLGNLKAAVAGEIRRQSGNQKNS